MATLLGGDTRSIADNRKRKAENPSPDENISGNIKPSILESAGFHIKNLDVKTYSRLNSLSRTIRALVNRLLDRKTETQFYAFNSIPKDIVDRIADNPSILGRSTRITYFRNEEVMIVKLMPREEHQSPHLTLASEIMHQVYLMETPRYELKPLGATTFKGRRIYKEADSSFKPELARLNMYEWPTLVIEGGNSESLQQLRNNAMLWISHSRGEVSIVVIISVQKSSKTLQIEKWCDQPITFRRSPRLPRIPRKSHTITVSHIPNTPTNQLASWKVVNAPLILEFNQIFLRAACPPETDISIGAAIFQDFAVGLLG